MQLVKKIGIIIIFFSLWLFADRIHFMRHAKTVTGTVTATHYLPRLDLQGMSAKISKAIVNEYFTIEYNVDEYKYSFHNSPLVSYLRLHNHHFTTGNEIQLLVNSKKPNNAFIDDPFELWTLPSFLLLCGFIFLILIPITIQTIFNLINNNFKNRIL